MKSLISILSILVLAFFVLPVGAQGHADHHPDGNAAVQGDSASGMGMMKGGMMQGGMMKSGMMGGKGMCSGMMKGGMKGGMMGMHSPLMKSMHTIKHLPDLKSKLDLTDAQVNKLKDMRTNYLKQKADWEAAIKKSEIDLKALVDKKASPSEIRKTLKSLYDVKLDMKVAAYETAQKMLSVLNKEQLEKYKTKMSGCMGGGMMGGKKGGMMGGKKGEKKGEMMKGSSSK